MGSLKASQVLEFYWDFSCPYSRLSFDFVTSQVFTYAQETYPDEIAIVFCHQVQPWHPQSTLLHESAIAVHRLAPHKFFDFSRLLFAHQSEYDT